MRRLVFGLLFIANCACCAGAFALDLGDISNKDAAAGLKQALTEGASAAVQ